MYGIDNLDNLQNEINNYHPKFYDSKNNIDLSAESTKQEEDEDEIEGDEPSVLMISSEGVPNEESPSEEASPEPPTDDEIDIESSGDGEEPTALPKTTFIPIPITTESQASMSSHLQRLSQLMQSMSNAQQNNNASNAKELTPNDLNTFLANYNIHAGINPPVQPLFNSQKHVMSPDGKIPADRLREIIRLQHKIQKLNENDDQLIRIDPIRFEDKVGVIPLREKGNNDPIKTIKLNGNGVSAAQIIVNRPEGSVLFSLPNHSPAQSNPEPEKNYLSQDTLRAVLDLSKQLIASSSQQQQQQGYLQQPVYRPMFYNVPVQDLPFPIITSISGSVQNDPKPKAEDEPSSPNMQKMSSVKGVVDSSSDDRTTVIHNHIPITIQTRKAVKPTKLPNDSEQPITDSYGEKIATSSPQHDSRVPYPPLNDQPSFYQQSLSNPIYPQYQQSAFPQIPQRFLPYYQQIYPENPHLSEYNVNSYVNLNTPAYPTLRPLSVAAPKPNDFKYPTYSDSTYVPMRRPAPHRSPSGSFASIDQSNIVRHDNNDFGDDEDVDTFDDNSSHEHDFDATDENVTGGLSTLIQRPSSANSNSASNLESKQTLENHAPNRPSFSSNGNDGPNNSSPLSGHHNKNDIVHYGSTYMSYQDYQQTVEPLLSKGGTDTIEVLSCVTGARQPHSSDCSKYFVCNAVTQKVLDYTCPSFTAFNRESRFCDAKSYAECKGDDPLKRPAITVAANRRIHLAAQESEAALANAQRVHNDAVRNQQLTAQLNRQTQLLLNQRNQAIQQSPITISTPPRRPSAAIPPRRPQAATFATTTTQAPRRKAPLKRIIKCNEPTKVRDSLSVYNYFTCFRGIDGKLQALKQTCPGGLVFCDRIKVCTLKERC